MDVEDCAAIAVDCGIAIHRRYGPGLLESAYETLLFHSLSAKGLRVERQKSLDMAYDGGVIARAYTLDLLINDMLVIEVKSVERLAPIHAQQLLTYLRLADLRLGLVMNFGGEKLKDGIRRVSNDYFGDWRKTPS
jgi:GxxExxY protein